MPNGSDSARESSLLDLTRKQFCWMMSEKDYREGTPIAESDLKILKGLAEKYGAKSLQHVLHSSQLSEEEKQTPEEILDNLNDQLYDEAQGLHEKIVRLESRTSKEISVIVRELELHDMKTDDSAKKMHDHYLKIFIKRIQQKLVDDTADIRRGTDSIFTTRCATYRAVINPIAKKIRDYNDLDNKKSALDKATSLLRQLNEQSKALNEASPSVENKNKREILCEKYSICKNEKAALEKEIKALESYGNVSRWCELLLKQCGVVRANSEVYRLVVALLIELHDLNRRREDFLFHERNSVGRTALVYDLLLVAEQAKRDSKMIRDSVMKQKDKIIDHALSFDSKKAKEYKKTIGKLEDELRTIVGTRVSGSRVTSYQGPTKYKPNRAEDQQNMMNMYGWSQQRVAILNALWEYLKSKKGDIASITSGSGQLVVYSQLDLPQEIQQPYMDMVLDKITLQNFYESVLKLDGKADPCLAALQQELGKIEAIDSVEESDRFYVEGEKSSQSGNIKRKLALICNMLGNVDPKRGKYSLLIPFPLDRREDAMVLYRQFFVNSASQKTAHSPSN